MVGIQLQPAAAHSLKVCCVESEDLGRISIILIAIELVIRYIMFTNPSTGKESGSLVFVMRYGHFQESKIPFH